jgi:2-methylcitrate dehydratase PrpD
MVETEVTKKLAEHVSKVRFEDIPADAIEKAKDCLLDQVGVELLGSTLEWNKIALHYVAEMGGRAESTIVNHGTQVPALDAAFVNATFGQGCELDDLGFGDGGHLSTATVPVGLALAEKEPVSGRELLSSIVVGSDVMYRLLAAVRHSSGKRGFHSHGIGGPFGAMVVAARLLKLSEKQTLNAFGIAGSHSAGTMEYDQSGGEVKRFHAGIAARSGMQSALLARLGLTGPTTIIEGKRGFCRVFADECDMDVITADLGESYKIMNVWFKIFPAVATVQGPIDVLATMMDEHGFSAADVEEVRVDIAETSLAHGGTIYEPKDVASAQFSLPFSLALRLLKHDNDLSLYMDSALWSDPQVLALGRKIKSYADPDAKGELNYNTTMEITLTGGRTFKQCQKYPPGTPLNPLSRVELRAKFRRLAGAVLVDHQIARIIETIEGLDHLDRAADLVPLLSPRF